MGKSLLIACMLVGCGSTHTGDGDIGDIASGDLVKAVDKAYCDLLVQCGLVDDVATCEMLYLDFSLNANVLAAIQAGTVIYHPDKARQCVNGIRAWTCDRTVIFTDRAQPDACLATFEGTVGDAGPCALDEQCLSQSCSVPASCSMACCQGTCTGATPPTRPAIGQSCANNLRCADGYCKTATKLCTAFIPVGSTCLTSAQCAPSTACIANTCQMLAPPGDACTTNSQCRDIGTTCSMTTMTCAPLGLTGAACAGNFDCAPFYQCATGDKCALKPRLGEACTTSCIDHSFCSTATQMCTAPQADGATCTGDLQCASNHCDPPTQKCSTPVICI